MTGEQQEGDLSGEQSPLRLEWRDTLGAIIAGVKSGQYPMRSGKDTIAKVSPKTASFIASYVEDYGEVIIEQTDAAWKRSVCFWEGDKWRALVDLSTLTEPISDLVLFVDIEPRNDQNHFVIRSVHVP